MSATMDIPGVLYGWDHAGSTAPIVGGGAVGGSGKVISQDDGDTSYVAFENPGGANALYGWDMFVTFPPTVIPGVLDSTSLVAVLKGPDARVISAAEIARVGANPLNYRIFMQMTHRDSGGGYIDEAFWAMDRSQDADYTEVVQPLKFPPGDPSIANPFVFDPTWPEYVTQDQITTGTVEYNPGGGFYLVSTYVGSTEAPTAAGPDLRFTYIALRVTYEPATGDVEGVRRRFY